MIAESKIERERQQIIDDYETYREQLIREGKTNANIEAALEALKPVIADNLDYFRYAEAKGYGEKGILSEDTTQNRALRNALISVLGQAIKWSVHEAEHLSFEILEEVNDHGCAHKVAEVLALN